MLNNHKYTAILLGVVLTIFVHAGLLFSQQTGKYQHQRQHTADVIPQFERNALPISVDNLAALSISFGINPTNPATAESKNENLDNLGTANAVLVAVSAQGTSLIAKVLVHKQGKPKLISLRIGDTVLGYRLDELNLTSAVFAQGDSQITLHMFKRDNTNVAAN